MKQIYLKFSMLLVCLIAGLSSAFATESPWSVTSFSGTIANNSITINGATWTLKDLTVGSNVNGEPAMSISSKKLKFGNGKNQFWSSYTLYTDYFEDYNVTKVIVSCYDNGGTTSSVTAKQGTVEIGTATVSSTSSAEYTLNTKKGQGGELDIIYNSTTQASYITAITVYYEGKNTEPFTVTFDANANGTCNTTSLTESAANAGVILPSCTANTLYQFTGWATTATATTADAGEAGDTYYPTAATTLYAVYNKLAAFSLVFKEGEGTTGDSSSKYDVSDVTNVFESGSEYVSSIDNMSNVYPARIGRGAKFGSSSSTGKLTINLKNSVTIGKIVVECAGYADGEANGFTINGTDYESTTYAAKGFEDLTYNTAGEINSITIATQSKRGYVKTITIYPADTYEDLTIGSTGYATYYNSAVAYTMPEDCEGYVFTEKDGLESAYEDGDVVPAGEPLVIYTTEPGTKTLTYATSTEDTYKSAGMNDLDGTDEETALTADVDSYFYALSLNAEGDANSVGFYWMNETGAAFTNGAHKAYLKLAKSAGSKSAYLFNDEATAINAISTEANVNAPAYNLAGQRVNANAKGIVIMNGHKYINK